jgi:hypothetical protein
MIVDVRSKGGSVYAGMKVGDDEGAEVKSGHDDCQEQAWQARGASRCGRTDRHSRIPAWAGGKGCQKLVVQGNGSSILSEHTVHTR